MFRTMWCLLLGLSLSATGCMSYRMVSLPAVHGNPDQLMHRRVRIRDGGDTVHEMRVTAVKYPMVEGARSDGVARVNMKDVIKLEFVEVNAVKTGFAVGGGLAAAALVFYLLAATIAAGSIS